MPASGTTLSEPANECMSHQLRLDMFVFFFNRTDISLPWRHNGLDDVSNHQPHHCLLSRLFGEDKKNHQSSASLAFVRGIHRGPVKSPHKWPVAGKMFPFDDVIILAALKTFTRFSTQTDMSFFRKLSPRAAPEVAKIKSSMASNRENIKITAFRFQWLKKHLLFA